MRAGHTAAERGGVVCKFANMRFSMDRKFLHAVNNTRDALRVSASILARARDEEHDIIQRQIRKGGERLSAERSPVDIHCRSLTFK